MNLDLVAAQIQAPASWLVQRSISIAHIARLNREYLKAKIAD